MIIEKYRASMPIEVLHSWAEEAQEELTQLRAEVAELRNNLERAYEAGWCKAAAWSGETHLLADIGSPAYIEDRDEALVDIAKVRVMREQLDALRKQEPLAYAEIDGGRIVHLSVTQDPFYPHLTPLYTHPSGGWNSEKTR